MTPEITAKISLWRQKAIAGSLSLEETKEAVAYLRGERKAAAQATTAAKRTKAVKNIPTADDLLSELGLDGEDA
jgi:hypothetical protein